MKISVVMATARDNYPILGMPNTFIFQPTIQSLENQSFTDFELIICDALYEMRRRKMKKMKTSFPLKHVKPKASVWEKLKAWRVCSQLNTALMHCEGELIVRIDDCCSFGPDFLEKFWSWHKRGYCAQALVIYHHGLKPLKYGETARKLYYQAYKWELSYDELIAKLEQLYRPGEIIRDSRWRFLEGKGVTLGDMKSWYYGYGSAPLKALLKLNGYDEKFDGLKSLEEVDLGSRLHMIGCKDLILDESLTVIEHFHGPISPKAFKLKCKPFKCNYGLYLYNIHRNLWKANWEKISFEDCRWIRNNICPSCPNNFRCMNEDLKAKFYVPGKLFQIWLENQASFNLKEERKKILEAYG